MMETRLIIAYCACDDIVKNSGIREQRHAKMRLAEVMTTALTAAMFFGGNQELARKFMISGNYVSHMVSKSQFNRKLHSIPKSLWEAVFNKLALEFKNENEKNEFLVDSFPVAVCHNVRANRCKIYASKRYFGYISSKSQYFYGIRIHMLTTEKGAPVEFLLRPGSMHDSKAFKEMSLTIPNWSVIYADSAYVDYKMENKLFREEKILLLPQRKSNSKHPMPETTEKIRKKKRRMVETAFSILEKLLPRSIHAVSRKGFELKIVSFIVAMAVLFVS